MDFLLENSINSEGLTLEDKIIGRGAAVLIAKMEIKYCHGRIISEKALPVLERYNINYTYDTLVERIQCQTETALTDTMNLEECYENLKKRAGREGSPL